MKKIFIPLILLTSCYSQHLARYSMPSVNFSSPEEMISESTSMATFQNDSILCENFIYFLISNDVIVDLKLYNIQGSLVDHLKIKANIGVNGIKLNIDKMDKGLYFYTLKNGEKTIAKKFIQYHIITEYTNGQNIVSLTIPDEITKDKIYQKIQRDTDIIIIEEKITNNSSCVQVQGANKDIVYRAVSKIRAIKYVNQMIIF